FRETLICIVLDGGKSNHINVEGMLRSRLKIVVGATVVTTVEIPWKSRIRKIEPEFPLLGGYHDLAPCCVPFENIDETAPSGGSIGENRVWKHLGSPFFPGMPEDPNAGSLPFGKGVCLSRCVNGAKIA